MPSTHILSKASYLTDEEKKQIPTNLIRYHTFIGSIEYEPEEMEEESEDEEEPQEPNETEEDSEENFRTLAKSLVLQLDETLPDIPPPPAILQSPQISQHISQLLDKSSSKTSSSKPVGKTPVKRTNSPGHPTCAKKPETRRPPSPGKTATSKASAKAAPTLRATPKTNSKI
ncbi:hypothetical protein BLNAU_14608 [Blattamonas nauphoetae]|uniref:Uncharacterized protein n=1 Tax=Blattamonas nauphoetae TaxID=2049346 RepID=A0ABQ9XGZ5_9EUKA|nr:hypothetical protein BLNAU_14608 [Blattamonas nauphoetae]